MAKTKTSFKKGEAKGKPKGALNHFTRDIKEAIRLLIINNLDNMQDWIKEIAAKDKAKAMNILVGLLEYNIPKLGKTALEIKQPQTDIQSIKIIRTVDLKEGNREIPKGDPNK